MRSWRPISFPQLKHFDRLRKLLWLNNRCCKTTCIWCLNESASLLTAFIAAKTLLFHDDWIFIVFTAFESVFCCFRIGPEWLSVVICYSDGFFYLHFFAALSRWMIPVLNRWILFCICLTRVLSTSCSWAAPSGAISHSAPLLCLCLLFLTQLDSLPTYLYSSLYI